MHFGSGWNRRDWPAAWTDCACNGALAILQPIAADQNKQNDAESDLARLEAILFLAREPLNTRKLSRYANLADGTRARTLIRQLNERYDASGRAMRVQQVAGGYQLLTRAKLAPWLRRLAHVPGETRLSAPALETLAVIAYRQPVPRADIEAIRGVNCGEILRQLMDRDLVRIGSRSEELGRPFLYATTKRFLELFGLNQIDELPRASELSQKSALPPVAAAVANQAGISRPPIDEIGHESTFAD
ncbi:MAG TPA: SMC-Scp complex subunit ScpB [Pirellulaceae bacterium]